MSEQAAIDLQRRIDRMKLDEKIAETFLLLNEAIKIIKSAADAGNVQCQNGIEHLRTVCLPKKSSN